jgi:hypothetical protein
LSLQRRFKKFPAPALVTAPSKPIAGVHDEQHYKVPELAKKWRLSNDFVRILFENEIGVIKIVRPEDPNKKGKDGKKGKRAYVSLRIPESVAARVHERLHGRRVA